MGTQHKWFYRGVSFFILSVVCVFTLLALEKSQAQTVSQREVPRLRYYSLQDLFKIEGILHSSAQKMIIGNSLFTGTNSPYLSIFNNLIFRTTNGTYFGPQILKNSSAEINNIILDHTDSLEIVSPNETLLFSSSGNQTALYSNNHIIADRGVSIGSQTNAPSPFSIKSPIVSSNIITSTTDKMLRIGSGAIRTILNTSSANSQIKEVRIGTEENNQPLCQIITIAVNVETYPNPIISPSTCPSETPYLLDGNIRARKIICCNACKMSTTVPGTAPNCSDAVTSLTLSTSE